MPADEQPLPYDETSPSARSNKRTQLIMWFIAAIFIPLLVALITIAPSLLDSNNPTDTPSNQPNPTHSPVSLTETIIPTPQTINPNTSITEYPCDAQILLGRGGLLNKVYIQPSESSQVTTPIQQGSQVQVLNTTDNLGIQWYQINYAEGNTGWIEAEYLALSNQCPQN